MTDSSIPDVPAFADALSPLERAAAGLQDELSVFEIALLTFPDKAADQKRLTDFLLETIETGRLAAYGNPKGWYARVSRPNQQPLSMRIRNRDSIMNLRPIALGEQWERCNPHEGTRTIRGIWKGYRAIFDDTDFHGDNCLIRRADYLALLATPAARGIPKLDGWKAPQDEPAPSAPALPQGEPDKPEQGAAATRQIALVEAEDAALATLRKELKREPDFEEFWLYIAERDDTGTISDYTNDRLIWTGKDGRNCETAKSTMRNRLTAAKKRNPFT